MTSQRRRRLHEFRATLWLLLVMALLFAVSSVPAGPPHDARLVEGLFSRIPPMVHNALHVPGYALLAWTLTPLLGRWLKPGASLGLAILIATAYGALLELHQLGVVGRYTSLGDAVLNLTGAVIGAAVARAGVGRRTRQERPVP